MKFQFHLYVQKHFNRTYTVTPLPFFDLTAYGNNLEEIRAELTEALSERVEEMNALTLHRLEYDSSVYLHKVTVEVRPVDPKKRNKRREKVRLGFSLLVTPQEDGQLYVQVPRLGQNGPTFYVYDRNELQEQAQIEISSWLDGSTLEQLQTYQYTRSEILEVLEIEVAIKKVKERNKNSSDSGSPFGRPEENFWALKEIGINMTAQAAEGRFRRAYRRDEQVEELMQILMSPRNNSVLLVGPSEAGKTAIVHELVRRIHRGDCPEPLQGRQLWMLSPDRIIAGAQYIGTWEERINNIMDECRKKQHILYVEDLPGLLEIGRWSKSDHNVALAIRPHLASGEVVMLGEGLPDRVQMGDNLGPGFMNVFRRVEIAAMNEEETGAVLKNVARDLERELDLRILPEANDTVVQLTRRFLPYRAFPGKAVRLLEETATEVARERTGGYTAGDHNPERFSLLRRRTSQTMVNRQSALATFSRTTGMPEFIVNDNARLNIEDVEKYFTERILGQEKAVSTVVNLIATVKAGLNDPNQPLGTLMFIGPTGVGKTQMAKTLAAFLFGNPERLIRFDMSEYRDYDGIAKLIGAFGKEGELTRKVREQPFSVVLLDEFEKADPRIFDVFLQVLGEGRLTDAGGKTAYFHNSIMIMTSNLGASAKSFSNYGFHHKDGVQQSAEVNEALELHYREQVETFFRPEFVNRIDHIVVFGQLAPVALRNIASREISDVLMRDGITRRNLLVEIEDSVIDLVLKTGYSPQFGARPLKREIERIVVSPLARELAQRSMQEANLVRVGVDRDTEMLYLKNVPIDEASTTVALTSAIASDKARHVRMDTGQLVEGFAVLRRKLADWLESDAFREMQNEKSELLIETRAPNFWDNNDDARTKMSRFYFLDRLTRRVKQLYERAEYLEDFAVLVNRERDLKYHSDLAGDYEELYRETSYLDIEMMTSHLPHRNRAMMLLQTIGMTPLQKVGDPKESWMRRLARVYLRWAERKGYDREIYVLMPDKQGPGGQSFKMVTAASFADLLRRFDDLGQTDEIALFFEGSNVFGFMKGERGVHRLEKDGIGDEMVRVQVFAIPDGTSVEEWLSDYREIRVDIEEGRRNAPPQEKHTIIRTYSPDKQGERFIRDMRTNVRTVQVKEVLEKGDLDDFILAYIEKEEAGVGWEDRFPPTFPF